MAGKCKGIKKPDGTSVHHGKGGNHRKKDIPQPYNPDFSDHGEGERRWMYAVDSLDKARDAFEKEYIQKKVQEADGDLVLAAKRMGKSVAFIKKKMD